MNDQPKRILIADEALSWRLRRNVGGKLSGRSA